MASPPSQKQEEKDQEYGTAPSPPTAAGPDTEQGQQHAHQQEQERKDKKLSLLSHFYSIMTPLTHEWGFVVVRTAYDPDPERDAAQWEEIAYPKLLGPAYNKAEMEKVAKIFKHVPSQNMGPVRAMPVMADRDALAGLSYDEVRVLFNEWVNDFMRRDGLDPDEDVDSWPFDIRTDCVLVVDENSLASLVAPDEDWVSKPGWVVAVDPDHDPVAAAAAAAAADSTGGPSQSTGRGHYNPLPYLGWMRATARTLGGLYDDLGGLDWDEELCPRRTREGQVPFYGLAKRPASTSLVDEWVL